jgi:hypothetical protein
MIECLQHAGELAKSNASLGSPSTSSVPQVDLENPSLPQLQPGASTSSMTKSDFPHAAGQDLLAGSPKISSTSGTTSGALKDSSTPPSSQMINTIPDSQTTPSL